MEWRSKKIGVFGSLKPFIWMSNISGLLTCEFSDNRLKPGSIYLRIWHFVCFGLRVIISIKCTDGGNAVMKKTLTIVIIFANMVQVVVAIIDFIVFTFYQKSFIKFYDTLLVYDDAVRNLGYPRTDSVRTYWLFFILVTLYMAQEILMILEKAENWLNVVRRILFAMAIPLMSLLTILKFSFFVHLVYQRFLHFNKTILTRVAWTRALTPKSKKSIAPTNIIFLHSTLVEASKILNGTYIVILPFWFLSILVTAIICIYAVNTGKKGVTLTQLASFFFEVLILCVVCDVTAAQGNASGKYITKDQPTLIDGSTAMDRVRVHLYLLHNRVTFNAGGFFVIDMPVFYAMWISIITYSLIMLSGTGNPTKSIVNATTPYTK